MVTLYGISLAVFTAYLIFAIFAANYLCFWDDNAANLSVGKNFIAIPKSLSATFYILQSVRKNLGYMFTLMMFICSFTILPLWIEQTGENFQFLAFFGSAGIAFVGAAPMFREEMEGIVHTGAAMVSAITAFIWGIISGYWWFMLISLMVCVALGLYTGTLKQCKTFWAEMAIFLSTYGCLLISII